MNTILLTDLFRFWVGSPQQKDSISLLEEDIYAIGFRGAMDRNRPWYKVWSSGHDLSSFKDALSLIKEFESLELRSYPDPSTGAEPWTIGYGITKYPGGNSVKRGDTITKEQAELYFRFEVYIALNILSSRIPFWGEMSNGQKGALLSFAFNCGNYFYGGKGYTTISKRLREKDWNKVPEALMLYIDPGSDVESGLRRRRKAEGDLWRSGKTE